VFGSLDRLLTPRQIVRHVRDVTPESLQRAGVRAVVTDLDNTLVPWHGEEIASEIAAWLAALRDADMKVCIASNTRNFARLERLARHLDILHVPGNAAKPGSKGLRKALSLLDAEPTEAAMVGDQLFTDIVAGNRLGLFTVLVNPLTTREFIGTKLISRNAERLVLRGERQRKA